MRENGPWTSSDLFKVTKSAFVSADATPTSLVALGIMSEVEGLALPLRQTLHYDSCQPPGNLWSVFPSELLTTCLLDFCLSFWKPRRADLTRLYRKEERAMRFPPEPWGLPCFLTGPPPPVSCLFHMYEPSFQLLLEQPGAANARRRWQRL